MKNIELNTNCYDKFIFKGSLALECYYDLDDIQRLSQVKLYKELGYLGPTYYPNKRQSLRLSIYLYKSLSMFL